MTKYPSTIIFYYNSLIIMHGKIQSPQQLFCSQTIPHFYFYARIAFQSRTYHMSLLHNVKSNALFSCGFKTKDLLFARPYLVFYFHTRNAFQSWTYIITNPTYVEFMLYFVVNRSNHEVVILFKYCANHAEMKFSVVFMYKISF